MTLYAFNVEIARIRESVHEAMAGMIRLQWWREVLSGARDEEAARNPVAGPLLDLVRRNNLPFDIFDTFLAARENDLRPAPFNDHASLGGYARLTAGQIAELATICLGAGDDDSRATARTVGESWARIGLLRALPVHLEQGWLTLPEDALVAVGTSQAEVQAGKPRGEALAMAVRNLAGQAGECLEQARARRVVPLAIPALLPATLAGAHLRRLARCRWNVFDERIMRPRPMPLTLAFNAWRGRF